MLHVRRLAASPLNGSAVLPFRFLPRERCLANSSGARQHMLRVRGWCGTFGVSKQIREERFVLNVRSEQNIKRYDLL